MGVSDWGNNADTPELLIESIGNACGDSVLKTAEKMILQENVDLTVSFCSIHNLKDLVSIFSAYKKNLIHLDLGGNVLTQEHVNPYVLHHTLNLWQSAYKSGEYAAKNFGKSAAIAASFYDGGYHLVESFVRGFIANGGSVAFSYVAPFYYITETYQALIDSIQNNNPDFVFSLFTYKEEQKVLGILSEKLEDKSLPVICSPLIGLNTETIKEYALENVVSISSWDFTPEEPEMHNFIQAFEKKYNASPNVISLLGFETGLTVLNSVDEEGNLPPELGTYSEDIKIRSPRGELSFNSFHESQTTGYFVSHYDFSKQPYERTALQQIDLNGEESLYDQFKDLPLSGWQNPYIIT